MKNSNTIKNKDNELELDQILDDNVNMVDFYTSYISCDLCERLVFSTNIDGICKYCIDDHTSIHHN